MMIKKLLYSALIASTCFSCTGPSPVFAYYEKSDYTENIWIRPNQTVFVIPDTGDNLDSQGKFFSQEYLDKKRIPSKRVEIKHQKLANSGLFSDYYVPTARAIVVDRALVYRKWIGSSVKGTSSKDESMDCQTAEGLNVNFGVTVSASIEEEDAAQYLYVHGIQPTTGDPKDPQVIFQSSFNARPLTEVIDTIGNGRIHSIICNLFSQKTMEDLNKNLSTVMIEVEKETVEFFKHSGITIQYVGLADTLNFDPRVQAAINRNFDTQQEAVSLKNLQPYLSVMQAEAINKSIDVLATKWDGKIPQLPSVFFNSSDMMSAAGALSTIFNKAGSVIPSMTSPAAPAK